MSPEQIRGEIPDAAASDVYSFACVVFELLTAAPYTAKPQRVCWSGICGLGPRPPSFTITMCPATAPTYLRRMMNKKREMRPKSMWEVLQAFREFQIFNRSRSRPV